MIHITTEALYEIFKQYPSVQTDSRKVADGDIFFALKGPNFNGNAYAEQALKQGAAYAVIDDPAYAHIDNTLLTDDVLNALQLLAAHHRNQFDIPFLAITGSNGKTTTKELIFATLHSKFKTQATEGNLNNHIGVPLTLLKLKTDTEMLIIEMGANHQKEIESYCKIAQPNFGLITNCGKAHLEGFGGIEGVRKAKGELYDYLRQYNGAIFRYADFDYLAAMSDGIASQITYGTANAQIIGKAIHEGFFLKVAILTSGLETIITTKLVGDYNLPNVLAAVAVGHHFGMNIDEIKTAIENYTPSNSRSQLIEINTNQIISDAYNANPASMKLALENMAQISSDNKWLMLGAMKEMGADTDFEHQALVNLATQLGFENVLLVGNEFQSIQHHFHWFENSEKAADFVKNNRPQHAVILVKGSRGSKMERILEVL